MTADEAARRLGVSRRLVYSYEQRGLLVGRRTRRGLLGVRLEVSATSVATLKARIEAGTETR